MEELYQTIQQRIKASGYPVPIDGEALYNEICDLIEGRDNGVYLLMSKQDENTIFEYNVTVMDENFNLSYVHITSPDGIFHIDFDSQP